MEGFNIYYIISPISGSIIGYFTNVVAIRMLFRPLTEKYLFGKKLPFTPGLIPKRRGVLARKVGESISVHLLTSETLTKSFCSPEVKHKIEEMADSFLNDIKNSQKTVAEMVFGKDCTDEEIKEKTASIFGYFVSDSFYEAVSNLDGNILDADKKIAELVPSEFSEAARRHIGTKGEDISKTLIDLMESSFFEKNIKPILISLISQNIKGLATLFVIPEKVYENFHKGITEYLSNEENYNEISEKILSAYDKIANANIAAIAESVKDEDGRILSRIIKKAEDENSFISTIGKDAKTHIADKLAVSALSLKTGDILSKIDNKYYKNLKRAIMSKYDTAITANLPKMLEAINLPTLIEEKINEFEVKEAEDIILSVVGKELKVITYLGGVLGFFIGLMPPILQSLGVN